MSLHISFTGKERRKDSCSKFHMRWQSHLSSRHCPQDFMYNYIVATRCPYYFSYHFPGRHVQGGAGAFPQQEQANREGA